MIVISREETHLVIYSSTARVINEAKFMNIQRLFFTLIYCSFILAFISGGFLIFVYALGPPEIENNNPITIVDRHGASLLDDVKEIEQLDDLPPYIIDGIILAEDRHFYNHYGLHLRGIARALIRNIEAQQLKEGASTITQQLARNLYLSHEKTWTRKLKELYYTIRLEMFYSKDEILTAYLNRIYFGHGAYGISEAAQFYFGKTVSQLSLAEATILIGIPKGPTYYSPYNNIDKATERQHYILKQLLQARVITEANYYEAKGESLSFKQNEARKTNNIDYFIDYVWDEATEQLHLKKHTLAKQKVKIETTLDLRLQQYSDQLLEGDSLLGSELQIGSIALEPKTGAIRQMTGGKDYNLSSFNRAVDGKRMVGSTFKPFLYYAALEHNFTATTMLQSEPTAFTMGNEVYEPSNYNNYYAYKPISLAQALALSDNIYAVKTHLFLSPEVVVEATRRFGITSYLPEVASLALGSASIPLIEMTQAYAMIANGGYETTPYAIEKITTEDGKLIYEKEHKDHPRLLDEKKAFLLTHLMTGMFDRRLNGYMEVTGSSMIDQLQHEFAGKSGTTSSDSWMIGFSPQLVVGTWTGYDDNRSMHKVEDKALAKQTWANMMQFAHENEREKLTFSPPEGVVSEVVDVETGLLATEDCQVSRTTYFESGSEPTAYCTDHLPVEHEEQLKQEEQDETWMKQILNFLP